MKDKFVYLNFSLNLVPLKEPNLHKLRKDKSKTSFRFLCERSFNGPFSIRVEIDSDGSGTLYFKESKFIFDLIKNKSIKLTKNDTEKLVNEINKENFWMLKSSDEEDEIGLDGSDWIIEGVENGNYHFVKRWSPEQGSVRNLGLFFIKLSQEKIDELY